MADTTLPPILPSETEAPEGYQEEKTGLTKREPVMVAGGGASVVTLVSSFAIILKHTYGVEIGDEVLSAIVDIILAVVAILSPIVAAKFARELVSPVN